MNLEKIAQYKEDIDKKLASAKKKVRFASNMRLLFALGIIVSFAEYFRRDMIVLLGLAIVFILAFSYFVSVFTKAMETVRFLETKLVILDRYEARLSNKWQSFSDTGSWYEGVSDPLSEDLDIFGEYSLYQYLSVAHTSAGRQHFAKTLIGKSDEDLKLRQDAVKELIEDDDFALSFEAMGYQFNDRKRKREEEAEKELIAYAKDNSPVPPFFLPIALGMPLLTLGAIGLGVMGILSPLYPICLLLAQIGLTVIFDDMLAKERDIILSFVERVQGYEDRLELLRKKDYQSALLKEMKADLDNVAKGIKKLQSIAELWQWRENFLFYWIVCGIFAWDFNLLLSLRRWKKEYGTSFEAWLSWIAKVECYLSLGVLGRIYPERTTLPTIVMQETPYIKVEDGYHPLLNPQTVVSNSYEQNGEMVIITGSNMSGKSTFMRMLGLNTVLAYAGGLVAAKSFVVSPMAIFTSMRVRDDVSQGISTFYGEILRIKRAVGYASEKKPMLILVDEIFKGTNSKDRILGAKAAITKLSKPWIVGIVTTHDFELADMVSNGEIIGKNFHFEEHYVDDEIKFDYTIKTGRSQSTNAKHLMRIAGLLDSEEG